MYREICQTDLSEFHSTVWEKSPKVSTKYILLCCMAIIAVFLERIFLKNSLRVQIHVSRVCDRLILLLMYRIPEESNSVKEKENKE